MITFHQFMENKIPPNAIPLNIDNLHITKTKAGDEPLKKKSPIDTRAGLDNTTKRTGSLKSRLLVSMHSCCPELRTGTENVTRK